MFFNKKSDLGLSGMGMFEFKEGKKGFIKAFFEGVLLYEFQEINPDDNEYLVEYDAHRLFIYSSNGLESWRPIGRELSHIVSLNVLSATGIPTGDIEVKQQTGEVKNGAIQWSDNN